MDRYSEGLRLLEESCGNSKDNVIALATIAVDPTVDGNPQPFVREVDAYYEDGVFYVTTWGKSNKMIQIAKSKEVGFVVCKEGISGSGIGENLGWVLDPEIAELRTKLRKAFSNWYDHANNEQDENCVILAIKMTRCAIFRDEGALRYNLDLVNKKEIE
ncbi:MULTISPECIES: pyridoxamine 5'-phosphate oxidase family protein [unclassified Fusibacter]|uniref:pyridoxamine 5'-phosphate oxidase family protein n=1 Tax=unclassified Fusibacter TaxID=2624464 RepID=UPI0010129BF0|nr:MULTISPECIES: pyridoxamine 5'-phosphate oxidase family protein [unclassified Fusibacter]MCK8061472.1 pyridoxamine 5'-phosphate oxidase family protein [Fusibacter sp. A2]NPE23657.1 pyridoxamine 5'-phosphate oxidase family protein [Fusibacter sp. A1]RXV58836.1 pyridoxamine 5'-phosphate oxidase family protein [Fusibacter sp. A1]